MREMQSKSEPEFASVWMRVPEAGSAFSSLPPRPNPTKALIFLDTNVLLAPYRASETALREVAETYSSLVRQRRLIVPGQVAREFARGRSNRIAELAKLVEDLRTVGVNGKYAPPPIVEELKEHRDARAAYDAAKEALAAFRQHAAKLLQTIQGWDTMDPVLAVYAKLFGEGVIRESSIPESRLAELARARYAVRFPPGYEDKGKADGGIGDLAIWMTILEVCGQARSGGILVTDEGKSDWFHRTADRASFVRAELREEFSIVTGGAGFAAMTLSAFLESAGAAAAVVTEIERAESASAPKAVAAVVTTDHAFLVQLRDSLTSLDLYSVQDSNQLAQLVRTRFIALTIVDGQEGYGEFASLEEVALHLPDDAVLMCIEVPLKEFRAVNAAVPKRMMIRIDGKSPDSIARLVAVLLKQPVVLAYGESKR